MKMMESVRKFTHLLDNLTMFFKLLNRDEKICYGLTWPQAYTVGTLFNNGPLTMSEMSGKLGVTLSTVTRILNILVRDGLISRNPGNMDRRQVTASLTEKGKDIAKKLIDCREKAIEGFLLSVPTEKRKNLVEAMETIRSALAGTKFCC
jgi:DNA-binding MarR family transcriptional regulator